MDNSEGEIEFHLFEESGQDYCDKVKLFVICVTFVFYVEEEEEERLFKIYSFSIPSQMVVQQR